MVVFGMVFNRINVGGLTMLGATGDSYFPSWMEITVTLGVISVAALVFLFVIEHFHVLGNSTKRSAVITGDTTII